MDQTCQRYKLMTAQSYFPFDCSLIVSSGSRTLYSHILKCHWPVFVWAAISEYFKCYKKFLVKIVFNTSKSNKFTIVQLISFLKKIDKNNLNNIFFNKIKIKLITSGSFFMSHSNLGIARALTRFKTRMRRNLSFLVKKCRIPKMNRIICKLQISWRRRPKIYQVYFGVILV